MDFTFNEELISGYHGATQKARVLTEDWVARNMYCPICGAPMLTQYEANRPVADFCCHECSADYELKSKERASSGIGDLITDGEYNTMIGRITSFNNPNFLFLTHSNLHVNNLVLIPNHFFIPEIIEKRKPLGPTERRAGWIGCNIRLTSIPSFGKIYVVKDSKEIDHEIVHNAYIKSYMLKTDNLQGRGWIMDVLQCIEKLGANFTLKEMYSFVPQLRSRHPENNNIEAKIRQQLQVLRDKGFIEFVSPGHYRMQKI